MRGKHVILDRKNTNNEDKEYNKRKTFIVLVLLVLLFISIGYSYVSTNLKIFGGATIGKMSWDVHYDDVVEDTVNNTVNAVNQVTYEEGSMKVTFDVIFTKPGDRYGFDLKITNDGSFDAKIGDAYSFGLTPEQEKYLQFNVTYKDRTKVQQNDLLRAGETKIIHVEVVYIGSSPILEDETLSTMFYLKYVQADQ